MKSTYFLCIILCCTIVSCERFQNKGQEIADKTEKKVKSKFHESLDKAFPQFDSYKSDTQFNKKRFEEYLEIKITADIKEIYCFGDFMGIDYKVLFSFTCDSITIERIVAVKELELIAAKENSELSFEVDFPWWDKERIQELNAFRKGEESKYWQYLWYDGDRKKAYYEEFSL